jgi:hypothetical protein
VLIHITIAFAGERVELRVERPHIHRRDDNLAALERYASKPKRGPMLLEVGKKAGELASRGDVIVKPIYDPDAFEPELTAGVIAYHHGVLYQLVRPRLVEAFTVGLFDRFRIDLLMPRFERLPAQAKDRFTRSLGIVWRRSQVHVNNQPLRRPR